MCFGSHHDRSGGLLRSFHSLTGRRCHFLAMANFMIDLSGHATTDTAKDDIGYKVDNTSNHIVSLTGCQAGDDGTKTGKDLQAIGTTNQANIILIQSQGIGFSNDIGRGTDGQSGTTKGFQTHAGHGTGLITDLSWLKATTPSKVSLTTHVIRPATARFDMIQGLVTQMNLGGAETCHTSQPTAGRFTGSLTETNVKGVTISSITPKGTAILALDFIVRQRLTRKAKQTCHGM
jgi:hypothetical protein